MQNKHISLKILLAGFLVIGTPAFAQEMPDVPPSVEDNLDDPLSDFSVGVSQKKTVDFPSRSSLDTMELAPLPGIYETNMNGPQPMAESVSVNDLPTEQLLGRLTPEVFKEMAELERDLAYLRLQSQKEEVKNDLERKRAQYRQDRLNEISNREKIIRERIQWWQEQEKLRLELEKERQEAEEAKNQLEEAQALQAQSEVMQVQEQIQEEEEEELTPQPLSEVVYELLNIKGTRGNLVAKVKNTTTGEITSVKMGDNLNGEVITAITPESVVIDRGGTEYFIKFPD